MDESAGGEELVGYLLQEEAEDKETFQMEMYKNPTSIDDWEAGNLKLLK